MESTNNEGLLSESAPSDDEGWDTDLEDCCKKTRSHDMSLEQMYLTACSELRVSPAATFIKQMTTTKVDLRHYGILDKGLQAICCALTRNITVITLNLHDNGVTKTGARALADLLEENCFITSLDISGNKIGIEGCRAMEQMLKNTSALRQLNFSNICSIGGNVLPLLEGLKESFYLKVLDLSHNSLEDQGAAVLGSILSKTSSLESLNISWNKISTRGAADIMDGLRECYTLKKLDFSWNSLARTGAEALRSAFEVNKSLVDLDVSNTSIGPPEAKLIAKGLKKNKTLQILRIGNNPYLSPGAFAFLKKIRRNHESALQELHLDGMALDRDCHKELDNILQKRPDFKCTWQISIQGGQASRALQGAGTASLLEVFARFGRSSGLRMADLFKKLSGKRDTIGEQAFVAGLKTMNIAMTKQELKSVFAILDVNGDGKLQFHEFPNLVALKLHDERLRNPRRIGKRK